MGEGEVALQKLTEAADAFLALAPQVTGNTQELLTFLRPFRVQLDRAEVGFAIVAGKLPDACRAEEYFHLGPVDGLRYYCHMASGAAAASVAVGENLQRVPQSRAALEQGSIGFAHLNLLARTAEFIGDGFREQQLLRKAEENAVTPFGRICAHARHAGDPAQFTQEERERHAGRTLELTTRSEDGMMFMRGWFDAEGGAYIRTAVEGLSQPLPNDDRLVGQRRADALVEIARVALDEGRLPERGGVRPHVQVTTTLDTLLGRSGAPAAELEGSGPISREMLLRIAGDCSIRRLILDEESMLIDVGRERRLFRGGSRIAIEHRDRGCVWPGCTRPARFCQADHEKDWVLGSDSNVDNGRLLCRLHHRMKSDGWTVTKVKDPVTSAGSWVVKPPIWSIWSRAG